MLVLNQLTTFMRSLFFQVGTLLLSIFSFVSIFTLLMGKIPTVFLYCIVLFLWILNTTTIVLAFFRKKKDLYAVFILLIHFFFWCGLSLFFLLQIIFVWPAILGKTICQLKGTNYQYTFTNHNSGQCFKLANDYQKICESELDCQGYCVASLSNSLDSVNEKGNITGTCTKYVKPALSYDDLRFCRRYLETVTPKEQFEKLVCSYKKIQ